MVGGRFRLALDGGEVRILGSEFTAPVEISGPPADVKSGVKVQVVGNSGKVRDQELSPGFSAGLRLVRVPNTLVRGNWINGGKVEFEDCGTLKFDGNTVIAQEVRFRQTAPGGFGKTSITKCDFHKGEIVFEVPRVAKADRVVCDKCWFGGLTDEDEILQQVIKDGTRDEGCGARVLFRKINERPLGIGGTPVR
jgi:hypothetical protein